MKESYGEGVANHIGHESCADNHEIIREAFDSGMYRLGIEPRKFYIRVLTPYLGVESNIENVGKSETFTNSAWSKTLYMYRNSSRGNWEILQLTSVKV